MQKTERQKGGRPKKTASEKRVHRYTILLDTLENIEFQSKVSKAKMPANEYIRAAIFKSVVKERMTPEACAFRRDITGMKTNLNQNAHKANAEGFFAAAKENRELCARLDAVLKKYGL